MLAEDKYNQIALWFNTSEPEPPTPTPLKTVGDFIARSFMIAFVISGIFFGIGIITNIIGSIWSFLSSNRWDIDDAIPTLITLAIIAFILTNIIYAILDARGNARKKAEYDEAKAEYDEAKAEYDALPSVSQMEQWLEEDLENLKKGALQQIGLDEESEIVADEVIMRARVRPSETRAQGFENHQSERRSSGFAFDFENHQSERRPSQTKAEDTGFADFENHQTENRHHLFPIWHLTILFICRRSIVIYRCEYNWSNNRLFNQSRPEYFYSDMGGIERQSAGFDEILRIHLSGGKSEEIVLNEEGCPEPSNRADMAARAIRSRIKDNKPEEPKPDN